MVEGKLSIWIKSGSFNHASDIYLQVLVDDKDVWRTDDKDGYTPNWDSTAVKHIKGEYEKIVFKLMDEDTFSRDDVLGTAEVPMSSVVDGGVNDSLELFDAEGNSVGTVEVNVNFEEGDVNFFDLMGSMLHKDD